MRHEQYDPLSKHNELQSRHPKSVYIKTSILTNLCIVSLRFYSLSCDVSCLGRFCGNQTTFNASFPEQTVHSQMNRSRKFHVSRHVFAEYWIDADCAQNVNRQISLVSLRYILHCNIDSNNLTDLIYKGASVVQWHRSGLLANRLSDRSCSRGMIHNNFIAFAQVVPGPV